MEKLKLINDIAVKNDIALVYIFGSRVKTGLDILKGVPKKNDDPLADIGIGVVFSSGLPSPGRRPERYSSIYNQLEELFAPFPVDLVFLQETHSVFQANAVCGHCIYSLSLDIKENYEENVLRRAADFRPFLERYLDEMLEDYLRK
ncbi:MAG: nucleotidyltransferase domain-containing protein [Bacillota bacterium]